MAFNIKNIFGNNGNDDQEVETIDETEGETVANAPFNSEKTVILLEPRAYSESQQIADYLKKKSSVIVNLKRVTPDQAKRIVDFLSGTLYAIEGDLQKLGGGIFLCTPHGMNVQGKISDDLSKGPKTNGKKEDSEKEDDDLYF